MDQVFPQLKTATAAGFKQKQKQIRKPSGHKSVLLLFKIAVISNIAQTNFIREKYNLAKSSDPIFFTLNFFQTKNLRTQEKFQTKKFVTPKNSYPNFLDPTFFLTTIIFRTKIF